MLVRKITKAVYDAFNGNDAWKKSAYKVDPSNADNYILDAEDGEGASEALRGKQHEIDEHKKTKQQLAEVTTERDALKTDKEALEAEKRAGWKKDEGRDKVEQDLRDKLKSEQDGRKSDNEAANKRFADHIANTEAEKMAADISTSPRMMAREIRDRIQVELIDGTPSVRVLDKDGKLSANSLADLRKEVIDNPEYKSVIKASGASGGGAGPGTNGGGSASPKAFKDMGDAERTALFQSNPAEFHRLNAEHQAASAGR